jgi:MYXO-CTERM domain-containing protein
MVSLFRSALGALVVAGLAGSAFANGRDPFISTINFKVGENTKIMAGATYGLVKSDDNGATWQWYCERAVGYGGTYDPDYVYTNTGAVFATTFDGLKVMRDGCTFAATPPGMTFVTHVERGPDNALYFTASHPMDTKIYKSTNDGVSFPQSASIPMTEDAWWQTIMIAPSDATRVYLSGYRLPKRCNAQSTNAGDPCGPDAGVCIESAPDAGACEAQKDFLLYKSVDGGMNFTAMNMTGITPTTVNSAIEIVGIDPTDEDIVYARVTLETLTAGESIYRSNDAGVSWTKILTRNSNIGGLAFLVRYDGSCVAGTRDIGAWKSPYTTNQGCGVGGESSWTELTTAPHIGCLAENDAHEVWACTQNTESVQLGITADGYGIMKSTDLAAWTGVLRFQDIQAPVACGVGTVQQDRCIDRYMEEQSQWCCLVPQLGITSDVIACTGYMACFGMRDEAEPDGMQKKPPEKGCFDCSSGGTPPVMLTVLVGAGLMMRRRRRPTRKN